MVFGSNANRCRAWTLKTGSPHAIMLSKNRCHLLPILPDEHTRKASVANSHVECLRAPDSAEFLQRNNMQVTPKLKSAETFMLVHA
jgi:hypothetical protein